MKHEAFLTPKKSGNEKIEKKYKHTRRGKAKTRMGCFDRQNGCHQTHQSHKTHQTNQGLKEAPL